MSERNRPLLRRSVKRFEDTDKRACSVGSTMRGWNLLVVVTLVALSVAGCVDAEVSDPNVTITVESAEKRPGACIFGDSANDTCHTLRVFIQNGNEREDVSTNMFYWEAVAASGGVYAPPEEVEGPDAIAPGAEGRVTLEFEVSEPSDLVQLRYEAVWMSEPVLAPIPAYT